jgi:hypothetical protein
MTRSELAVAELAANGLTNREIAERPVSPETSIRIEEHPAEAVEWISYALSGSGLWRRSRSRGSIHGCGR